MSEEEKPKTTDEKINYILRQIDQYIGKEKLKPDWKDAFFSGKQLNDLREILEMKGFSIAKVFQQGRIDRKGNQWDYKKNKILLYTIELLEKSGLDMTTSSYFLGKLNQIIYQFRERKEENK